MAEKKVLKTGIRPGTLAVFDVEGTRVAVANLGGTFHAFDDTCTHRQCSLAEGILEGTTVTCPCHGGEFDVTTGAVLSPPPVQPVRSYSVAVEGDTLKIEV
jgi:3-phenylpropionate/trans-cinnamate dioxygenase ferredoxin subunit